MNDRLFRDMLNLLLNAAETERDVARMEGREVDRDKWSAIAGNLDYARQGLRR